MEISLLSSVRVEGLEGVVLRPGRGCFVELAGVNGFGTVFLCLLSGVGGWPA